MQILIRRETVDINIARTENETPFDYHKRLVYGKLVDKTLSDIDYSELSALAYGQAYSSDVARRMFYGSRKTLELMDSENVSVDGSEDNIRKKLDELDMKIVEYQKERQRYSDQRREYFKLVNTDGRRDNLYERLTDAAFELANTVGSIYLDSPVPSLAFGKNEAILFLSDWHYGMVTSNVFNTYNTEICIDRIKQIVSKTKERLMLNECSVLRIVILGDLIHGAIHTNCRVAAEELVCDQLMQASEILAQTIIDLSRYVKKTYVYSTYGNHARTVQNKNDSTHRDNMERLIPWWLDVRIKAQEAVSGELNIHICDEPEDEFIEIDSCGRTILATHGDLDSLSGSLRTFPTVFAKKRKKDIEYIVFGDKHHRESKEEIGVTAQICGSLCGSDEHANTKRLYSTPSQLLLIVNEAEGVDGEYKLKCE